MRRLIKRWFLCRSCDRTIFFANKVPGTGERVCSHCAWMWAKAKARRDLRRGHKRYYLGVIQKIMEEKANA